MTSPIEMRSVEYLIQYGRSAFVGRFLASDDCDASRNQRVVVQSPRGQELGVVLGVVDKRFAKQVDLAAGGELLRIATSTDEHEVARLREVETEILTVAERQITESELPLTVLDAEVLLDGTAILHAIPWDQCDADPLFAELSSWFARPVRLLDLSRTPVPREAPQKSGGCGKPGCGSGGCSDGGCGTKSSGGCSTGGCSRGAVKSADELTAYFAGLRQQMEATAQRTPLN